MLISFKQKTYAAKVVQVFISKLNTEMIDRLRQLQGPSIETAGRYRKITGCHTKGYACLMGEKGFSHNVYQMSHVMRKPTFCICKNKEADQLRGNREADQRLCFRYIDSTIPLFSKPEISRL